MSLSLVWDPLFRLPLATGLLLAIALPLLGAGLRLRNQWLSGLGLAQIAAAGGVAATLIGVPVMLAAALAAGAAGLLRALWRSPRHEYYAVMLLGGWAAVLLLATLGHHAEVTAQSLLDGQLYFTGLPHFWGAALLLLGLLFLGRWLSSRLLRARLFPDHFSANRSPAWPHELAFEALLVGAVVLAINSLGVMASFAMLLIPPWVAFHLARGWPAALLLSAALGLSAYLLAFMLAIALDLPFGPVLVAALLLTLPLRLSPWRLHIGTRPADGNASARPNAD